MQIFEVAFQELKTAAVLSVSVSLLVLFPRNTIKLLLNFFVTISRTIKLEQGTSAGSTAWNALFIYYLKGIPNSLHTPVVCSSLHAAKTALKNSKVTGEKV